MTNGGFTKPWIPGVASKTPSLRLPAVVRTKPSRMPSGDQAGIRSGSVVEIGDGAANGFITVEVGGVAHQGHPVTGPSVDAIAAALTTVNAEKAEHLRLSLADDMRSNGLQLVRIDSDRVGTPVLLGSGTPGGPVIQVNEPARGTPAAETAQQLGIALSLPPHEHPLGHEWALETGREATLTVSRVTGPEQAAQIANRETSGLAATIVTSDEVVAREFLDSYTGTGAFWNASTRLLDGFKLCRVPETGINVDRAPGPRGPVTFADLYLRQFVIIPMS